MIKRFESVSLSEASGQVPTICNSLKKNHLIKCDTVLTQKFFEWGGKPDALSFFFF